MSLQNCQYGFPNVFDFYLANTLTLTGNDSGQRLDRFLRKKFPQIPLAMIYKLLRQKKIKLIRGEKKSHPQKSEMLQKDDVLHFYFDEKAFGAAPQKKKVDFGFLLKSPFFRQHFHIHFEDEFLFIAYKNAGIAVHPGSKTPWGKSLIDLFVAHARAQDSDTPEPKLAHRLDKETSGLVLISKNDATLRKLTALIREGQIQKKYLALVKGKFSKPSGVITLKLLRTEGSRYTKIQTSYAEEAKESRTFYKVLGYFPEMDASLVEVDLDTGRMHQIRVHFTSQGHPLAGDETYGDFAWNRELQKKHGLKRQFLHAFSLQLQHPETRKVMTFVAELPPELKKVLPAAFAIRYNAPAAH